MSNSVTGWKWRHFGHKDATRTFAYHYVNKCFFFVSEFHYVKAFIVKKRSIGGVRIQTSGPARKRTQCPSKRTGLDSCDFWWSHENG